MNQQPYYHRVTVLFTCVDPMYEIDFEKILKRAMQEHHASYVAGSLEIDEFCEPEPGDPADLM